jgi:hypothetical protein
MTDFSRVLLTDKIAWELFGLASRERLLYLADAHDSAPIPMRGPVSQRTLSLLVLFDKIIIHDFSEGSYRIPDLEKEGIIEIIAVATQLNQLSPCERVGKRAHSGLADDRRRHSCDPSGYLRKSAG